MLAIEPIGRPPLRRPTWPVPGTRPLLIGVLGGALLLIAIVGPTMAADPTATPTASPTANPTATPAATPNPTPTPTPAPTASPAPTPTPDPISPPPPDPTPPVAPVSLDLYVTSGFRYQDPNYVACTSTSAMNMLNFILAAGSGGTDFRWTRAVSGGARDAMLRWERNHDTLPWARAPTRTAGETR